MVGGQPCRSKGIDIVEAGQARAMSFDNRALFPSCFHHAPDTLVTFGIWITNRRPIHDLTQGNHTQIFLEESTHFLIAIVSAGLFINRGRCRRANSGENFQWATRIFCGDPKLYILHAHNIGKLVGSFDGPSVATGNHQGCLVFRREIAAFNMFVRLAKARHSP